MPPPRAGLFADLDPTPPTPAPKPAPVRSAGIFADIDPEKTYHRDRLSKYLETGEGRQTRTGEKVYNADLLTEMRQRAAEEEVGGLQAIRDRESAYRAANPVPPTPAGVPSIGPDLRSPGGRAMDLVRATGRGARTGTYQTAAAIDTALNGVGLFPDAQTQNMHDLANESARASDLGGAQGTLSGGAELVTGVIGYADPILAPIIAGGQGRRDVLDATGGGVLAQGDQTKANVVGAGSAILTALAPGAGRGVGKSISARAPVAIAPVAESAATGAAFMAPQPILTGMVAGDDQRLQDQSRAGIAALPEGVAAMTALGLAPRLPSIMRRRGAPQALPAANLPAGEHRRLERLWDDVEGLPSDQRLPVADGVRPAKPAGMFADLDPARHTDTEPKAPAVDGADHEVDLLDGFDPEQLGAFGRLGGGTETVPLEAVREARAQAPTEPNVEPLQRDVVPRGTETATNVQSDQESNVLGGGSARAAMAEGGFKERHRQAPQDASAETRRIEPVAVADPAPAAARTTTTATDDTFGSPEGEHRPDDLVDAYIPSTKKTVRAQVEKVNPDGTLRLKTEGGSILPRIAGHRVTKVKEEATNVAGRAGPGTPAPGEPGVAPAARERVQPAAPAPVDAQQTIADVRTRAPQSEPERVAPPVRETTDGADVTPVARAEPRADAEVATAVDASPEVAKARDTNDDFTNLPDTSPAPPPKAADPAPSTFAVGQRLRFARGKRKGVEVTVQSIRPDGRPILRGDDGKVMGEGHGITPDILEPVNARPEAQPEPTPEPAAARPEEPAAKPVDQPARKEVPAVAAQPKPAPAPQPAAKPPNMAKLRESAAKVRSDAQDVQNRDRNTNTPKRQRQAASAIGEAMFHERMAKTADRIADAVERGEAPELANVNSLKDVEAINEALRRARIKRMSYSDEQKVKDDPFTVDDLNSPYEPAFVHETHVNDLLKAAAGTKGVAQLRAEIGRQNNGNGYIISTPKQAVAMAELAKRGGDKEKHSAKSLNEAVTKARRWFRMGATDAQSYRAILKSYLDHQQGVDPKAKAAQALKAKEDALRFSDIPGFFPTPPELVRSVIEKADIKPGMRVLEPEAGKGDIALAAKEAGATVDVAETHSSLREILEAKGLKPVEHDMLDIKPEGEGQYDRIVMNPPFENGQDRQHVQHAYTLLKPGGRLVAVMSTGPWQRSMKADVAFREWAERVGATKDDNAEGAFAGNDAFRQTGVRTVTVTIEKPANGGDGQESPVRDLEGNSVAIDAPKSGRLDGPALRKQWNKATGGRDQIDQNAETREQKPVSDDRGQESSDRMFEAEKAGESVTSKRIPVAPLEGGNGGKKTKDILLDFTQAIGKPIRIGKGGSERTNAAGAYFPGTSKAVVKYHNDIDTTAHELAHALDDEFGIVGEWAGKKTSPFDDELEPFWQHGSKPFANMNAEKAQTYRRAEGVAEYLRAALLNPKAAREAAPQFAAFVKSKLPGEVRQALNNFSDDVRRWAGTGALDRTMANVRDVGGVSGKGLTARLREQLRGGEQGSLFKYGFLDRVKEEVVDAFWPVIKAVRTAKDANGRELLPEDDPEVLMRMVAGGNDVMTEILDHGPVDLDGKPRAGIEGGADWLLDWADTSSQETIKKDSLMAAAVGISERVGDELGKMSSRATEAMASAKTADAKTKVTDDLRARMQRLTGAGGGIFSDVSVARKALMEFSQMPEKDQARIREGIRRMRVWNDATLRHLVDGGILSEESYARIKKENPHYVDMHRVMEQEKIGEALKTFKGSMRQIDNPFVSTLAMTDSVYRQVAHNQALRKFRDLLVSDREMYDGKPVALDSIGRRMEESEGDGTKIMVDGKPERWQFQEDIQRALDNWGQNPVTGAVDKALMATKKILTAGITHSPPFMLRNVFRDAVNRGIISENGSRPWDVFHKIDKSDLAAYRRAGGGQAGHYLSDRVDYHKEMAKRVRELAKDDKTILTLPGAQRFATSLPGRALSGWGNLAKGSEIVGRMAEFRAAKAKAKAMGYNDRNQNLYAASQSRGLMDYAVAGNLMKGTYARYVPFLNPIIQGQHRSYTAAKTNPMGFAKRWSAYVLTTSLLFKGLQAATESAEDTEEYRQLPAWRKDMFWNLKIGERWLSLPKPFELGALAAPIERAIDQARGDENAYDGLAGSMAKSVMPIDDGTMAGPLRATVEAMANWDFFRDKHIVSPYEENKDVSLRKGSLNASHVGQALQSMFGIDARKADHWIRGTFGTLGGMALSGTDAVTGNERTTTDGLLQSFIGLTTTTPTYGARDVEWVMKEADRRGEAQRRPIRGLRNLLRAAIDAPAGEREAKAREARRVASGLRKSYEAREPVAPKR